MNHIRIWVKIVGQGLHNSVSWIQWTVANMVSFEWITPKELEVNDTILMDFALI